MSDGILSYKLKKGDGQMIMGDFERDPRLSTWRKPVELRFCKPEVVDDPDASEEPVQMTARRVRTMRSQRPAQNHWIVQEKKDPASARDPRRFRGQAKNVIGNCFLFKVTRPAVDAIGEESQGLVTVYPLHSSHTFRFERSRKETQASLNEIDEARRRRQLEQKKRYSTKKKSSKLMDRLKAIGKEGEESDDDALEEASYRFGGDRRLMKREVEAAGKIIKDEKGADAKDKAEDEIRYDDEDEEEGGGAAKRGKGGFAGDFDFGDLGEDEGNMKPVYLGSDDEVDNADEEGVADPLQEDDYGDYGGGEADEEAASDNSDVESGDSDVASDSDYGSDEYSARDMESAFESNRPQKRKAGDVSDGAGDGDAKRSRIEQSDTGFRPITEASVAAAIRDYGRPVTRNEYLAPFMAEMSAYLKDGRKDLAVAVKNRVKAIVRTIAKKTSHGTKGTVYDLKPQYL